MKFVSNNFLQYEENSGADPVISRMMYALNIKRESELIEVLHIDRKTISTWRYRGAVPLDRCDKIAREYHLSLDFLLYGKGTPHLKEESPRPSEGLNLNEAAVTAHVDPAEQAGTANSEIAGRPAPDVFGCPEYRELCENFVLVPRYDIAVCAGYDRLNAEIPSPEHMAFRQEWLHQMGLNPTQLCVFTARGDSMSPTLNDGDILLIDTRSVDTIRDSGIYVIGDDEGLRVKRLQRRTDGILIISDNPMYKGEFVRSPVAGRLRIIGRAVWTGKLL